MRSPAIALALWLLAGGAFLAAAPPEKGAAGKAESPPLKIDGELTADTPKDAVRKNSHAKIHRIKLAASKSYQIDMRSNQIDSYLRLEDPAGKQVAEDDDGGGFPNARIVYKAATDGVYKVIATTYQGGQTGKYTLTLKEAPAVIVDLAKLNQELQKQQAALVKEYREAKSPEEKGKIEARFMDIVGRHNERVAEIAEKHIGDKAVKGQIALVLGQSLRDAADRAYQKHNKARSEQLAKRAGELFTRVATGPGESPALVTSAEDALYQLKHLSVGKPAPDITAEDIEGKKLKLSDFRGKVVVLDFWGNW
jgi:hypothetical protein